MCVRGAVPPGRALELLAVADMLHLPELRRACEVLVADDREGRPDAPALEALAGVAEVALPRRLCAQGALALGGLGGSLLSKGL